MRATSVIVALAAVILTTSCGGNSIFGPDNRFSAEATFDYSVLAEGRSSLSVEGINGPIQVLGVNGASEVSISGIKRVEAKTQDQADTGLGELAVEIDSVTAEVTVRTVQPSDDRTFTVNYLIEIPDDWVVHITNGNGDVTAADLKDDVLVECANGVVSASVDGGDVIVSVGNGGIDATATMAPGGLVDLDMGNGGATLRIPQDTSAKFEALVGNGTITTSNLTLTDVTQTPKSLKGTLGLGDGTISVSVGNGTIGVRGI